MEFARDRCQQRGDRFRDRIGTGVNEFDLDNDLDDDHDLNIFFRL